LRMEAAGSSKILVPTYQITVEPIAPILLPWGWKQQVPPKYWYLLTKLQSIHAKSAFTYMFSWDH
jgi:hypothetical protein